MEGVKAYELVEVLHRKRTEFWKLKVEKESSSWRRVGGEGAASRRGKPQLSRRGSSRRLANILLPAALLWPCLCFLSCLCSCIQLPSALYFKQPHLSPSPQWEVFFSICPEHMGTIFLLFPLLKRKGRNNTHRSLSCFFQNS